MKRVYLKPTCKLLHNHSVNKGIQIDDDSYIKGSNIAYRLRSEVTARLDNLALIMNLCKIRLLKKSDY